MAKIPKDILLPYLERFSCLNIIRQVLRALYEPHRFLDSVDLTLEKLSFSENTMSQLMVKCANTEELEKKQKKKK